MAKQDYQLLKLPVEGMLPKGLLYHYTTLEGLLGIINTPSIRATHIRYMNDPSEFRDAFEQRYTKVLIDSIGKGSNIISDWFTKIRLYDEDNDRFLLSFTDDEAISKDERLQPGDRLSQWRAYGNGSGGFSLGLENKRILANLKKFQPKGTGGNIRGYRCSYSAAEKEKIVKDIAEYNIRYFRRFRAEQKAAFIEDNQRKSTEKEGKSIDKRAAIQTIAASFAHYFLAASSFKDEAFSEEREWRIVFFARRELLLQKHRMSSDKPIIRFRAGKLGVTPYVEFPLELTTPESPLQRIVVGPTPHKKEAVNGVKLLLESKGIKVRTEDSKEGVEVVPSKIPYRDW